MQCLVNHCTQQAAWPPHLAQRLAHPLPSKPHPWLVAAVACWHHCQQWPPLYSYYRCTKGTTGVEHC